MEESIGSIWQVATDKAKLVSYLNHEIKEKFERLAARRNRTMSNMVETLIIQEVEKAEAEGEI